MLYQRISRWLILAILVIFVIESGSATICFFLLTPLKASQFVWNPDLKQVRDNWNALGSAVDEEIGGIRVSGSKDNAEFPDSGQACGSAYGDSYVGGAEVAPAEGWVEQISHILGCRVTNYAVGGYGTDQAYLRFRRDYDRSPIVLLGINPDNAMDNVGQYDGFIGGPLEPTELKGRFLLDAFERLEWVPRPRLDADGFVAMHRNPAETLPHSYFLPDIRDGPVSLRFPYAVTLGRVALTPRLHDILQRRTEWSSYFSADDPSEALRLMVAICKAFVGLANSRGKRALIVMLPLAGSFRQQAHFGKFEYAPLVAALEAKGIETFDPGPAMIDKLQGRSACDFFTRAHPEMAWLTSPLPCGGHYSTFGNTAMAHLVVAELRRRNFIQR